MVGRGWCSPGARLPSFNLVPFESRGRGHCRGKPGSSLSGRYAPDSVRAKTSSIVDEPGDCCTFVRENQRREPRGF